MKYDKYDEVAISTDVLEYRFISTGSKGTINKLVQYTHIGEDVYNLAFGDELMDGTVDYDINSNNGDLTKVLATVASTIYSFINKYPDKIVFLSGSTDLRNRVYKRAIFNNWPEINLTFIIFGVIAIDNSDEYATEILDINNNLKTYTGFYILKNSNI